jgi:molybdopterin/thiamine biosynthesis adenylyltransferase
VGWLARRTGEAQAAVVAALSEVHGSVSVVDRAPISTWPDDEVARLGIDAQGVGLAVALTAEFPYSVPRIYVTDDHADRLGAHFEDLGRVCLVGDEASVDPDRPGAVVLFLVQEALALLAGNASGENDGDFSVDFTAYWKRSAQSSFQIRAELNIGGPPRLVSVWKGKAFYHIAENDEECDRWLSNRFGPDKTRSFEKALLVELKTAPKPQAYPSTPLDLHRIIVAEAPSAVPVFERAIKAEKSFLVLLGVAGSDHLAAVRVEAPVRSAAPRQVREAGSKGFRPGRVPAVIKLTRARSVRMPVIRVDQARSRLPSAVRTSLVDRRVLIVGCGSLGSGVARMLVLGGLGHLTLIDGDVLSWANIGRHELGADAVGLPKASALAKALKLTYPSVRSVRSFDDDVLAVRNLTDLIAEHDVVLSLTGAWNAEVGLNDLMVASGLRIPTIYGWMERNASAGHALAITSQSGCLRCAFTSTGDARLPATIWRTRQTNERCGDATSPYSAVDLVQPQALVTELAIDLLLNRAAPPLWRSWLGSTSELEARGGFWNYHWRTRFGDPGRGRIYTASPFEPTDGCPCGSF